MTFTGDGDRSRCRRVETPLIVSAPVWSADGLGVVLLTVASREWEITGVGFAPWIGVAARRTTYVEVDAPKSTEFRFGAGRE